MACIRRLLPLPLRKPAAISICVSLDKTFMDKLVGKLRLVEWAKKLPSLVLCDLGFGAPIKFRVTQLGREMLAHIL
jgi:hypothetical protein